MHLHVSRQADWQRTRQNGTEQNKRFLMLLQKSLTSFYEVIWHKTLPCASGLFSGGRAAPDNCSSVSNTWTDLHVLFVMLISFSLFSCLAMHTWRSVVRTKLYMRVLVDPMYYNWTILFILIACIHYNKYCCYSCISRTNNIGTCNT